MNIISNAVRYNKEKGVYWDYYHDDTRTYEKMLDIHAQLSDNIIFAGGSWI